VNRILEARQSGPFHTLSDFRVRTGIRTDDLRALVKVGACDSIADGRTRPMMLWEIDAAQGQTQGRKDAQTQPEGLSPTLRPCVIASLRLPEYTPDRRRREEFELLGFSTDCHPMSLHQEALRRFRLVKATELDRHVGKHVLCAGMLTTAKPVHTAKDEPMQFATFDDGEGLIETVLFPEIHRTRGHVLFDQGPFVLRGMVEEEFGGITLTVTHLERLERMLSKLQDAKRSMARPHPQIRSGP
jgi:DNA polymerase III alpha subunit